ncbi:dual specificity protein phosphatase 1-like [Argentina anserina]|uniref:dual specificity protein phosphatase 1-like n=1 Tax=Argentina anserina TaxID=57926 RepID=UPI00217678EB|nr:dual specificity protein phosphatase 1-like [Potentilla anserina]
MARRSGQSGFIVKHKRPTLSTNWDFNFPDAVAAAAPPHVPRFEELDTTNMLLLQRIIFLGSQVSPSLGDIRWMNPSGRSFGVFISHGLFLGSIGATHNRDELNNLNFTHILTVASSLAPTYSNEYVYLKQQFDECFNYIEEAKRSGSVLVHCFVGKSRSVTIVLAYLMKRHGMSLNEALEHVRSRRPRASPNASFLTSSMKSHCF